MKAWLIESEAIAANWVIAASTRGRARMTQAMSAVEASIQPTLRDAFVDLRVTRAPQYDKAAFNARREGQTLSSEAMEIA